MKKSVVIAPRWNGFELRRFSNLINLLSDKKKIIQSVKKVYKPNYSSEVPKIAILLFGVG